MLYLRGKMLEKIKNSRYLHEISLILASFFWGIAFIWTKTAMNQGLTATQVILVRYTVSVLMMLPFCIKELKKATKKDWILGLTGGVFIGGGMLVQTMGLGMTTPSNSVFITTTYVVMVPFVSWIVEKKKPQVKMYFCALMALAGLYVLTRVPGEGIVINAATLLTLLSALLFAFQVVFITYAGQRMNVKLLTFMPVLFTAVLALGISVFTGEIHMSSTNMVSSVLNVACAAFFATILAGLMQAASQKHVGSAKSAIYMSLESVFTLIVSVIFGFDAMSLSLIAGGVLIVASIIIAELK